MSRLVVVSNRVEGHTQDSHAAGGLSVAILGCLQEHSGLWFGWNGAVDELDRSVRIRRKGKITYATVSLNAQEYDDYYMGFSNSTLWPCFHDKPDYIRFDPAVYRNYRRVNRSWALHLKKLLTPDDVLWVHDYHLIPFAHYCREFGIKNRIGFFLHIPFPEIDMLSHIPCADELLRDLTHYDLVGFHTESYRTAFENCLTFLPQEKPYDMSAWQDDLDYGEVRTGVFPLGIDHHNIRDVAYKSHVCDRTLSDGGKKKTIISVDRLDYSKGLLERLDAYELFLHHYPEHLNQVDYLQVVPDCRMENPFYCMLHHAFHSRVQQINRRFFAEGQSPLTLLDDTLPREEVVRLLSHARVGLVTPWRDGMNLLAKEYVAAQNPENPGVLVLSRYAGAAVELEAALQIEPEKPASIASALHRALAMSKSERRQRYASLMDALERNPLEYWSENFLASLMLSSAQRRRSEDFPYPMDEYFLPFKDKWSGGDKGEWN